MKLTLALLSAAAFAAEPSLLETIRGGNAAALKIALDNGADANTTDARGVTALHYAAFYSTPEAMNLLLAHGAKPNASSNAGATPLMSAAGNLQKVKLLVEKGAEPTTGALRTAAYLESGAPVVEFLLSHGAKPDTQCLNGALTRGNIPLARRFLAMGVTPDGGSVRGAAAIQDESLLRAILETNKKLGGPEPGSNVTSLMQAAYLGPAGSVRLLLDRGSDIKAKDNRGRTALMYAASSDFAGLEIVKMLLAAGADPETTEVRGEKAIHFARLRNDVAMVKLLGGEPSAPAPEPAVKTNEPPPVRQAIERSLHLLDTTGQAFWKANACISCHSQSIPQMAAGRARQAGLPYTLSPSLSKGILGVLAGSIDHYWQNNCSIGGRVATITYGLVGLAADGQPANPVIDAVTACIANTQGPDGSWWINDLRPPLGRDRIKFTALAVRSLQLYPLPGLKTEFDARIAHARQFLEQAKPGTTQSAAFRLLGMKWAGSSEVLIAEAARQLAALQRADGGWAQQPGLVSDAYATAQAVWALEDGGGYPVTNPGWRRGAGYLRATQRADGSWYVRSRGLGFQPYRETGFPYGHDQWLSSAATAFAVMALAPLAK